MVLLEGVVDPREDHHVRALEVHPEAERRRLRDERVERPGVDRLDGLVLRGLARVGGDLGDLHAPRPEGLGEERRLLVVLDPDHGAVALRGVARDEFGHRLGLARGHALHRADLLALRPGHGLVEEAAGDLGELRLRRDPDRIVEELGLPAPLRGRADLAGDLLLLRRELHLHVGEHGRGDGLEARREPVHRRVADPDRPARHEGVERLLRVRPQDPAEVFGRVEEVREELLVVGDGAHEEGLRGVLPHLVRGRRGRAAEAILQGLEGREDVLPERAPGLLDLRRLVEGRAPKLRKVLGLAEHVDVDDAKRGRVRVVDPRAEPALPVEEVRGGGRVGPELLVLPEEREHDAFRGDHKDLLRGALRHLPRPRPETRALAEAAPAEDVEAAAAKRDVDHVPLIGIEEGGLVVVETARERAHVHAETGEVGDVAGEGAGLGVHLDARERGLDRDEGPVALDPEVGEREGRARVRDRDRERGVAEGGERHASPPGAVVVGVATECSNGSSTSIRWCGIGM